MNSVLLQDGFDYLSIHADAGQIGRLERYIAEIEMWNRKINLVKAKGDQLIVRHILDSAAGLRFIEDCGPECLLDAGSGAGFPGIVLAILLPDVRCTLVEKSGKRAAFLKNCAALLELKNCTVFEGDLANQPDLFDVVCCRAFRPLTVAFEGLAERLARGGTMVFYKGRKEAVEEEADSIADRTESYLRRLVSLDVPFLKEERHLLLYQDTSR